MGGQGCLGRTDKCQSSRHFSLCAHEIGKMQDALQHADSDLEHAQSLYNSVAPFLKGSELAEKVAQEREQAQKTLAAAQQAQVPETKETP